MKTPSWLTAHLRHSPSWWASTLLLPPLERDPGPLILYAGLYRAEIYYRPGTRSTDTTTMVSSDKPQWKELRIFLLFFGHHLVVITDGIRLLLQLYENFHCACAKNIMYFKRYTMKTSCRFNWTIQQDGVGLLHGPYENVFCLIMFASHKQFWFSYSFLYLVYQLFWGLIQKFVEHLNKIKTRVFNLLTHNREYWNAVSSFVCRLSVVVANNYLICRLGSAAFAEFIGHHLFRRAKSFKFLMLITSDRVKIQLNL